MNVSLWCRKDLFMTISSEIWLANDENHLFWIFARLFIHSNRPKSSIEFKKKKSFYGTTHNSNHWSYINSILKN